MLHTILNGGVPDPFFAPTQKIKRYLAVLDYFSHKAVTGCYRGATQQSLQGDITFQL